MVTFQAAEPVVTLVVGDWMVLEAPSNGLFKASQVTVVIDPQNYDVFPLPGGPVGPFYSTVMDGNTDGLAQKTSGVVYPYADFFSILQYAPQTNLSALRYKQDTELAGFFYYCHTLFEKIVTDAGFTLDRTAIDNVLWTELALACPLPIFVLQSSDSVIVNQEKAFNQTVSGIGQGVGTTTSRIEFDTDGITDELVTIWRFATDNYEWLDAPATVLFEVSLQVSNQTSGIGTTVTLELHHDAAIIDSIIFDQTDTPATVSLSATVSALTNDEFYLFVVAANGNGSSGGEITIEATPTSSLILLGKAGSTANRTITNPAVWLPEFTKRDFLTGLMAMQNIVMQTDDLEKTVTLEYFDGINDNPEQSVTIDTSKEATKSTVIGAYFRNSKFQYREESGILRTDTSIIFEIDDERLALDGTVIELPFAACDNSTLYVDRDNLPPPIANVLSYEFELDNTTGIQWSINDNNILFDEGVEINIGDYVGSTEASGATQEYRRVINVVSTTLAEITGTWALIAQTKAEVSTIFRMTEAATLGKIVRITDMQAAFNICEGFLLNSITGGQAPSTDPQNPEHTGKFVLDGFDTVFDSTMLWSSLSPTYYTELLEALKNPLTLQLEVYLTVAEFDALDFLRPIYLGDPYNASFYINRISQFVSGQPVRLDLFRISIT